MHFSKTYSQLLESLPPELQENAIQYRQLKKIINKIVKELSSLGLSPDLLHKLFEVQDERPFTHLKISDCDSTSALASSIASIHLNAEDNHTLNNGASFPKVIYEFGEDSSKIEPRLRISLESLGKLGNFLHVGTESKEALEESEASVSFDDDDEPQLVVATSTLGELPPPGDSLLWSMQKAEIDSRPWQTSIDNDTPSDSREVIIPLVSDSQFFELLYTTLEHTSAHLKSVQDDFLETLTTLSRTIASSARPASTSHSTLGGQFHALSPLKDHAGSVRVHSNLSKSDLYIWREIFQLYIEAEVFESVHEHDRGERSVEESENRLQLFAKQVTQRGLAAQGKFKLKQSRSALETFLQLNIFILNIKKFQLANSEATRKILKKHTKRTALPLPPDPSSSNSPPQLALIPQVRTFSLPRILVQAIGETLLPVIPHLEDYSCLICTSIAFKPIRLDCGHLFCVRCLVKMQKRGKGDCPMCRAPSVLVANRSNVDWALMNFMQDWFPLEAKEKLKANEKEAAAEELEELGLDPNSSCVIM